MGRYSQYAFIGKDGGTYTFDFSPVECQRCKTCFKVMTEDEVPYHAKWHFITLEEDLNNEEKH